MMRNKSVTIVLASLLIILAGYLLYTKINTSDKMSKNGVSTVKMIDTKTPTGYPCEGKYTLSNNPLGIDIPAPYSTEIKVTADGVVKEAGWIDDGFGYRIVLTHTDDLSTLYAHCSKLFVKSGESVQKGQMIALVGSTGTADHSFVHYEIQKNGLPIDPTKFSISGRLAP
jgi:murein DD-endopeptidase MepM/ murein hydrolase activator NlpD